MLPRFKNIDIRERAASARELLKGCRLCPRLCGADRTSGEEGFCRTLDKNPFVSSWGAHHGEERPISGRSGSGTIFFGNCNLACVFCQNWSISQTGEGLYISPRRLAGIMVELEQNGCHNINLVSPSHQVPMILDALAIAAADGLGIPIVYNSNGYDSVETLRLLDGIVDIYMPDFKYWDPEAAGRYSDAPDYPQVAMAALKEMHRQVGDLVVEGGVAGRGLLVRHLVLPGRLAGTKEIMRFIAREISKNTYMNIMDQYHPCFNANRYPPLDRRLTGGEFKEALKAALEAGLKRLDGADF